MILLNLFYILMPAAIYMAFIWAPPADVLGNSSRIMYFHVPLAWISALAFFISGIYSIIFFLDKKNKSSASEKAYNSAVLGMVFIVLTVITGSIWSKISWGAYWNWDPRETSVVVLFLIYFAYFSLRSALKENPRKGKLCSAYLVIAVAVMPFLVFVIPRVYASLHPDPVINSQMKIMLDVKMKLTLAVSAAAFTLMFLYIFSMYNRILEIARRTGADDGQN